MKLTVHTDGGSRGNPGKGASAFVIEAEEKTGAEKNRVICGKYLGFVTNNEAEYEAVIEALKTVQSSPQKAGQAPFKVQNLEEIIIKSDSLLLVSQLSGKWKIKDRNLQQKARQVKELERELGVPVRYLHIPRELNREADAEVNRVLDKSDIV